MISFTFRVVMGAAVSVLLWYLMNIFGFSFLRLSDILPFQYNQMMILLTGGAVALVFFYLAYRAFTESRLFLAAFYNLIALSFTVIGLKGIMNPGLLSVVTMLVNIYTAGVAAWAVMRLFGRSF